jgi:hypothetical protein
MQLNEHYSLPHLVATFKRAAALSPEGDEVIEQGLRAVLRDITDAARLAAARDLQRYDHRSLYEFCAALDHTTHDPFRNE